MISEKPESERITPSRAFHCSWNKTQTRHPGHQKPTLSASADPGLTGPRRVSRCFYPQSPGPGRRDTSSNASWKESPTHLASGFPQISLNQI